MDLLAAVYALLGGSPSGKLSDLRKPLADLLTAQNVKSAAFIMLPPNPIEEHDQYRDSLALMWLDRLINRRGFASKEFGCAPAGRPTEARQGRLVFGVEEGSAADLARAVGQMTAVVIAADGSARAVPSIS
jgi:hypothetical protein